MQERPTDNIKAMVAEKYMAYCNLMNQLVLPNEHADEIKDQEAETAEIEDETAAATQAIEKGQEKQEITIAHEIEQMILLQIRYLEE